MALDALPAEFAEHGYEGASTRRIAQRVDAHQPQINYHFDSKESLWEAAVDHLFAELIEDVGALSPDEIEDDDELAAALAAAVRRFVHFAADHDQQVEQVIDCLQTLR